MSDSPITSGKFLVDEELDREYRLRNKDRFEQSIDKEASIPEGWKVLREYKTKTRIYRDKSISRRLEDKVWKLFYLLGARKLSTNDFRLLIREQKRKKKSKQLDVVAIVDDNVFVVECKTRKKLGRKSLKKDIAEFAAIKSQISNSLRRALDRRDLQFIFVLATENINWYENDTIDADETAIIRRDEYDIMALTELAQLAGEGAKFQIYNRIFFEKKVKGFDVKVPALKSKMGGHTYYSFILPPVELLKISYVHHREGPSSFLDLANSYQRMIKKSRIRKIESFIQDGGFFPGNIILNFHKRFPKEEPIGDRKHLDVLDQSAKPVAITLPPYFGSAWIIDGQHRLYGFADIPERATETLPVIAFVEESPSLEAEIFVDINDNQKPIGANLLWDLYEDLYRDSSNQNEQQLYAISRIAKELNSRTDSPFNSHIQIPKEQNRGNITLRAICSSIKQQRLLARDEKLLFSESYGDSIKYATDRIVAFFNIFREVLPDEWNSGNDHYIRTNAGTYVLMGIFREMIDGYMSATEISRLRQFEDSARKFLEPLLLHFMEADQSTIDNYRGAGGAGQKSRQVRYELTKVITEAIGYRSIWLEKYEDSRSRSVELEKQREGLNYYLDKDESEALEFKGSLLLDVDRLLLGNGSSSEDQEIAKEGVLKTIVAFLNSKGGEIIVGILERNRYGKVEEAKLDDLLIHNDKIIFGIEREYRKDEWDGYYRRFLALIENRIGEDIIDEDLVKIDRLSFDDVDLARITVEPAETKQFLDNSIFYVRRGNKTVSLAGKQIDRYWKGRKPDQK